MAWAAWDSNLDSYLANNFPECNSVTIATETGEYVCTSREKDGGPRPTTAELSVLSSFLKTKASGPDGLSYGGHKLMFTRDIDDIISIFNFKGEELKGAIAVCKSASGSFLIFAAGAGNDKNSQAVGLQAIKFVEFLKNSL